MKAREFLQDILQGGIPAAVDGIRAENNPAPEQTAPTGTLVDRIPGLNYFGGSTVTPAQTQARILAITALLVAGLGIVWYLRR